MAETTTCSLKILTSPFSIVEVGKLLSAKGQRVTTLGFEGNVVSLSQLFNSSTAMGKQPQTIHQRMGGAMFKYSFIYNDR